MVVILQDFYPLVNSKLVKTCNKTALFYQEIVRFYYLQLIQATLQDTYDAIPRYSNFQF